MANTQLNARFQVRYDTLANWNTNNPFLLQGEIAIVEIPAQTNAGVVITEPAFLMKVGTGDTETTTVNGVSMKKSQFKALPYVTAQAGDVYQWAKEANKPAYNAAEIMMAASGEDANVSVAAKIAEIITSGGDTNTVYQLEVGSGDNAGKIRLNYKDSSAQDYTNGSWITVGQTVEAKDDSILVDTTTAGKAKVQAQVSGKANNAISVETGNGEKGLYVPKASVTAYTGAAGSGEVDVLTGIATSDGHTFTQSITQVYTKDKIDSLINPTMEFKGVKTATEIGSLTGVKVGDSYKISTGGTVNSSDTVKTGDLVIYVAKGTTPETYEWAIIPSGDESFTDTWRAISINGTQALGNATSTGGVDFVNGTGINITNDSGIKISVDSTIATKTYADDLVNALDKTITAGTSSSKQKVFTQIVQTDGKLTDGFTSAVLSIDDIDVGDYLLLNGGNASSFSGS